MAREVQVALLVNEILPEDEQRNLSGSFQDVKDSSRSGHGKSTLIALLHLFVSK